MRVIYEKESYKVLGVILGRVTSMIPSSKIGDRSSYVDIDYSYKNLDEPIIKYIEEQKENLIGKKIIISKNFVDFEDIPTDKKVTQVIIDLDNLHFHKDIEIYSKKAKDKGVIVEIVDNEVRISVFIKKDDTIVGKIELIKESCCKYYYLEGEVYDREYYPHYIGFTEIIKYLQKKEIKFLNLGEFAYEDTKEGKDLNRFKLKWNTTIDDYIYK